MRILIHNVDTYLGKTLVSELRRADGGNHRVFGTVAKKPEDAPKVVKRIVGREDPKRAKKMTETMQSCKVIVIDLFNSSLEDLHFAIKALKVDPTANPPKPTGEFENEVIFVLVSSAMVWANTKIDDDERPLKGSDYALREPVPGSRYEQWKEMEELVMNCFNREGSTVKGLVVAGGALYGEGEDAFRKLFKDAWCGERNHVIHGNGANRVPTVHVRDLARLIRHVMDDGAIVAAETPYFLAVDQPPPKAEGQPSLASTQIEIVNGTINEICVPYDVPYVEAWPAAAPATSHEEEGDSGDPEAKDDAEVTERCRETMDLNLWMEPSEHMLNPEFAAFSDPPGWFCQSGMLENVKKIADEFCKARKLRAMRVLVGGPPASGKTTLAKQISQHFRIPHLDFDEEKDAEKMVGILSSRVCRYRGYVLDAGTRGFDEVERLFRFDLEVPRGEDEETPVVDDEADGETEQQPRQTTRQLHDDICPAYVIVTQAPRGLCEARWKQFYGGNSSLDFNVIMAKYAGSNLNDGVHSLSDFFQELARCSVLNLPIAGKDEEDMFESARIYMERDGRPFNYLATEAEVAKGILEARAAKCEENAKLADEKAKNGLLDDEAASLAELSRHAERMKIIKKHAEEHCQLKQMPLREYLMEFMIPALTEGLIECCKVLPENPADYLANFLENTAKAGPECLDDGA